MEVLIFHVFSAGDRCDHQRQIIRLIASIKSFANTFFFHVLPLNKINNRTKTTAMISHFNVSSYMMPEYDLARGKIFGLIFPLAVSTIGLYLAFG